MKKTILCAALIFAFTLPAHASEWTADDNARQPEFTFEFDMHEILAQADEARTRARVEADKAREEAVTAAHDSVEWARDFAEHMQSSMSFMFADRAGRGHLVKGQPYSADVVTETNQTLPDGNVITQRKVNKVFRDGEGRTRQETYRTDKLRSVYISDPVAGVAYTVLPDSKIAVAIPRVNFTDFHTAPRARVERIERRDGDKPGKTSTETETSPDGRRVIVRTTSRDGEPGVREEVRVQVVRVGDDSSITIAPTPPTPPTLPTPSRAAIPAIPPTPPMPPMAAIPGVNTMRFESTSHLGKGERKSLGTKDFEGVKAEGKSITWTIPAGQIGNRNPINIVSESWYSPELQVTVYSRHNDPRTAESVYRLASIKRAEPQADLFKVPEGYTVKGRAREKAKDKP